jgi:hypothetical protein
VPGCHVLYNLLLHTAPLLITLASDAWVAEDTETPACICTSAPLPLQGFGNVGAWAADILTDHGGKVED